MKRLTISTFLAVALLSGCSSTEKVIPDVPPSDLYSTAQQALQSGNWNNAIQRLEAMDSRYPFGAYSDQVQLDLIYAYYKNDDLALSQATIQSFLRLNPTSPQADWVIYMRGLNYMAQDRSFLHDLFNIDRFNRDPTPSRQAFRDFKYLLERFPNSRYDADAKARMIFLKNQLAEYDLTVADFYIRRGAWIAAINRSEQVQRLYPDTNAARKSLLVEKTAYAKLKLEKEVSRTEAMIKLNPVK